MLEAIHRNLDIDIIFLDYAKYKTCFLPLMENFSPEKLEKYLNEMQTVLSAEQDDEKWNHIKQFYPDVVQTARKMEIAIAEDNLQRCRKSIDDPVKTDIHCILYPLLFFTCSVWERGLFYVDQVYNPPDAFLRCFKNALYAINNYVESGYKMIDLFAPIGQSGDDFPIYHFEVTRELLRDLHEALIKQEVKDENLRLDLEFLKNVVQRSVEGEVLLLFREL